MLVNSTSGVLSTSGIFSYFINAAHNSSCCATTLIRTSLQMSTIIYGAGSYGTIANVFFTYVGLG